MVGVEIAIEAKIINGSRKKVPQSPGWNEAKSRLPIE
jgi:hypothetical protein